MAKKTLYYCTECGYESSGWLGKCPGCGAWNKMVEAPTYAHSDLKAGSKNRGRSWLDQKIDQQNLSRSSSAKAEHPSKTLLDLKDIGHDVEQRYSSGIQELDDVLGGGLVRGALLLFGGQPGIGKSTLLLQICQASELKGDILYVCGEESPSQIKLRADRLGIQRPGIKLLPEVVFERIAEIILALKPVFVIVDSIQTLYSEELSSAPGSVSQVREVAAGFLRLAKGLGCTICLVGHVTKDGSLAGPRVLEHMVDTVLDFSGDGSSSLRLLRSSKNRFGATHHLGLFNMGREGLTPVKDASSALLEGRPIGVPGSSITCGLEGNRPLLHEIQALINRTAFGQGSRMTQGIDRNRLMLLIALLEKQFSWDLSIYDVFINVVGGLNISETACDLAILAALISSYKNRPLRPSTVFFGEVGLTGESRRIPHIESRLQEAARYGFKTVICPSACRRTADRVAQQVGIQVLYVDQLTEFLDLCLDDAAPKSG